MPGPTIDTPPRGAGEPRQVRIDLANRLSGHDYQSLTGGECTCRTMTGEACTPAGLHDACAAAAGHGGHDAHCTCTDADGEACEHMFDFNVTNLHAHGAHTRPDYSRGGEACEAVERDGIRYACRECGDDVCDGDDGDDSCFHADNVLNTVAPGQGARYRWDIDEDHTHHAGLQWYHPHIHGTTAIQVASGAAGAWIVRGELDALPGVADARERVMVFWTPPIGSSAYEPLADGEACSEDTITFDDFSVLGSTNALQVNMINDQRRPRLLAAPGQVERWRILHAGFLDEVFLGVFRGEDSDCTAFSTAEADTLELTQIGRDGLILPQPFEHDHVFMSPGYRVEAVLGGEGRLQHGDTWCVVAARFLQDTERDEFGRFGGQPMAPPVEPRPEDIVARFQSDGDVVAILNVADDAGPATATALPDYDALTALSQDLDLEGVPIAERCAAAAAVTDPAEIDQAAILQVGAATVDDPDPCGCTNYNVNCHNFEQTDRSVYPVDRDLMLGAVEHWRVQASLDGHPFHIHINPFIVCPSDNPFDPLPFAHWRDTYLVNLDRKIDAIVHNESYTGAYVFHCHKLTHEDEGMMQLIRTCDPAEDATCGDYGWRECAGGDLGCVQKRAATECALSTRTDVEAFACITGLGAPDAVCGPNACGSDEDCGALDCVDHVCTCREDARCAASERCAGGACVPAPCVPPCGPGASCVHGTCE